MSGKKADLRGVCLIAIAWLIGTAGICSPSWAGSFSVNPVQISLPAGERTASLTIKNSDAAPVSIRAQVLKWTQVDGIDRYSATTNVITSPPIFTIPAGGTQLVRVGLRDRGVARAYRLILEEIPTQEKVPGQVQVTLRLNLPIYLLPKGGGKPDVSWHAWRSSDGIVTIESQNRGSGHLQVVQILAEQDGRKTILSKSMGVVLPGSSRIWKSATEAPLRIGTPFTLIVKSPAGETQARIPLESR
jgi:fimbrial chaperone protein